jgi:HEAT repeat protein
LPELTKNGLLTSLANDSFSFSHPVICAYLAGHALAGAKVDELFAQPPWLLRNLTIRYLASKRDLSKQAKGLLSKDEDPLHRDLLWAGRWLREIPKDQGWRKLILSSFAQIINDPSQLMAVRTRALSALALTDDPDIAALFRHYLEAPDVNTRGLAALGCGIRRDPQAVNALAQLLNDHPVVSRAACLALVLIGTQAALEAAAGALLQGSEPVRRAAAEAFANHPEEGYPILREGITMDDLLVRRAVIYGLRRVREPWSLEILEQIQIEDAQWVVKNAAAQACEEFKEADPHIPIPPSPLENLPWLISFAGERGVGISPGEPARNMLLQALKEGSPEEQLAAMAQIQRRGIPAVFPAIYHLLYGDDSEVSEAAYETIWHLASSGVEIPPPIQFGLG